MLEHASIQKTSHSSAMKPIQMTLHSYPLPIVWSTSCSPCTSLSVAKELCEAVEMKPPALKELITAFSREQKEKEPRVMLR